MTGRQPPGLVGDILHVLLDRYEQPGRRQVVRVRLNKRDQPGYFSAVESAPRREANAALDLLANAGIIRLHWRKWEEGNWLEAVDLIAERAEDLFTLIGRTPTMRRISSYCGCLRNNWVCIPASLSGMAPLHSRSPHMIGVRLPYSAITPGLQTVCR